MKFRCIVVITGILFSFTASAANSEWWNDMGASMKATDDVTVSLKLGQKFTSFKTLYFYDFKPNGKYMVNDIFDILAGYRLERIKGKSWGTQNRIEGGAGLKWALGVFKFYDANQVEHIIPASGSSKTNYKNKLSITYPYEIFGQNFGLTLWDELYFSFNSTEFNRNRLSFVVSTNIIKNLAFGLGYMLESVKSASWNSIHIMTSDLTYSF